MKLKGLKKAVGEFQRYNLGGYDSSNIINLSKIMSKYELDITMKSVKQFITENFEGVK